MLFLLSVERSQSLGITGLSVLSVLAVMCIVNITCITLFVTAEQDSRCHDNTVGCCDVD